MINKKTKEQTIAQRVLITYLNSNHRGTLTCYLIFSNLIATHHSYQTERVSNKAVRQTQSDSTIVIKL